MLSSAILVVDLLTLLKFVITTFFVGVAAVLLVKGTASKHLIVGSFGDGDNFDARRVMAVAVAVEESAEGACFVCQKSTTKKCSRCKAVRYCSFSCQKQDWEAGHRVKCMSAKIESGRNLKDVDLGAKKSTRQMGALCNANSLPNMVPRQPRKVLFPYDEFVNLFNWEKPGLPPCGLLNCGNSCFANVVLQCLSSTRPLIAYLVERDHSKECSRNDWCFMCELQVHIRRVRQTLQPFLPMNILSRIPNIGGNLGYGKQEDAHEFMRFAIDTMQSVCLDEFGGEKVVETSSQETTLIHHIFGGYLQSQVVCSGCNIISNRYENMMDLTVEIQGDAESLEECLEQFTAKEWLDGENKYRCDGCNAYVKAWKRLSVRQAPNILTIALKRFQSGRFGKLNKRVAFPETLDLAPYMSEVGVSSTFYKLYAVVVHLDMLNASFFGHYICYTKDIRGTWYRIDDCDVVKVELEEVLSQRAYMLLYSRVHVRPAIDKPLEASKKDDEPMGTVGVHQSSSNFEVQCTRGKDSIKKPSSNIGPCILYVDDGHVTSGNHSEDSPSIISSHRPSCSSEICPDQEADSVVDVNQQFHQENCTARDSKLDSSQYLNGSLTEDTVSLLCTNVAKPNCQRLRHGDTSANGVLYDSRPAPKSCTEAPIVVPLPRVPVPENGEDTNEGNGRICSNEIRKDSSLSTPNESITMLEEQCNVQSVYKKPDDGIIKNGGIPSNEIFDENDLSACKDGVRVFSEKFVASSVAERTDGGILGNGSVFSNRMKNNDSSLSPKKIPRSHPRSKPTFALGFLNKTATKKLQPKV